MAELIPDVVSKNSPPGEVKVAERLAEDPATEGWIVFHSLYLANALRKKSGSRSFPKVAGEIDFLILIPERGIVCVEVKSHEKFYYENGKWLNSARQPFTDPFAQVRDAMFTLQKQLPKFIPWVSDVPFTSLVWFTGTSADKLRTHYEFDERMYLDRRAFLDGIASTILEKVDAQIDYLVDCRAVSDSKTRKFTKRHVEQLATVLRPSFELVEDVGLRREFDERELNELLEEQKHALDLLSGNRSVIFQGAAGTGKTFLAMEQARRAAERGNRTLLVCYNRNLAKHLQAVQSQFERDFGTNHVEVSTIHALMLADAQLDVPRGADHEFWSMELPEEAAFARIDKKPVYDEIIVDEAQDFSSEMYFEYLSFLVESGLSGGRIHFFGDFANQQIYSRNDVRAIIEDRAHPAHFVLDRNCRNRPKIARLVPGLALGRISDRFLRSDDGVAPRFVHDSEARALAKELNEIVGGYLNEGFKPNEIILLSPKSRDSFAERQGKIGKYPLRQYDPNQALGSGEIGYSTIHSFKGLESKVVILTDVESTFPQIHQLLYVGLTRARDRLTVAVTQDELSRIMGLSDETY